MENCEERKKTPKYGYKAFNEDWTCRGLQYRLGETVYMDPKEISMCERGFHYCADPRDLTSYRNMTPDVKIALVKDTGDGSYSDDVKTVTNELTPVCEISFAEWSSMVNRGKMNIGGFNKGDSNYGDFNRGCSNNGSFNEGNSNKGKRNSGNRNNGYGNAGDCNYGSFNAGSHNVGWNNKGECNSGSCNDGFYNHGNHNVGFWNRGSRCYGIFNTEPSIGPNAFNKPIGPEWFSKLKIEEFSTSYDGTPMSLMRLIPSFLCNVMYDAPLVEWKSDPVARVYPPTDGCVGCGKLIIHTLQECAEKACAKAIYGNCHSIATEKENKRCLVRELEQMPNWDPVTFKEITGIDVNDLREEEH